jgi:hypothetical protein
VEDIERRDHLETLRANENHQKVWNLACADKAE